MTTHESTQPRKLNRGIIVLGIIAMVLLMAIPLAVVKDTEFGGSDGLGAETVKTIAPAYDETWASNVWEPPGGETESMLFALQAIAGGILIGYFFGYKRGQKASGGS